MMDPLDWLAMVAVICYVACVALIRVIVGSLRKRS